MAKRVNKKLLIIVTVVIAVGGVAVMAARYIGPKFFKKSAAEYVEESQRHEAQGDVYQAVMSYGAAVGEDPQNVELRFGLGELYDRHVVSDQQNLNKARQVYEGVLGLDPNYKPALERLLDYNYAYMKLDPRPESFNIVRDAARRMLAADPNNVKAKARLNIVTVRQVLRNVPTRNVEIEQATKALQELRKQHPSDSEIAFWAFQGDLYLAQQKLRRVADVDEARADLQRIEKEIAALLKGQPTNAPMQLRGAQLYS